MDIVPEVGANHGGDIDAAHTMIDALATQGADCIKFQIYTVGELISNPERLVTWGKAPNEIREPLGQMFERLSLPWSAYGELFAHAREVDLEPFGTPFSSAGLSRLLELGVQRIKIASSDVTYLDFLRECAQTGLPIILSLGKSTLAQADRAVAVLEDAGCSEITLLHCVAAYPAPIEDANLRVITTLRQAFPTCSIGYSDHTQSLVAPVVAVTLGAEMIERHVTLDPCEPGPDNWFSLPISEFTGFATMLKEARTVLGSGRKAISPSEKAASRNGTRSLIAARDLKAGDVITTENVKVVRPGTGIPPDLLEAITGLATTVDVPQNTPLAWPMLKA